MPRKFEGTENAKLQKMAAKMADRFHYFWTHGDGEGGYVLGLIKAGFERAERESCQSYAGRVSHE